MNEEFYKALEKRIENLEKDSIIREALREINQTLKRIADVLEEQYK
jgi:hypothetical protein